MVISMANEPPSAEMQSKVCSGMRLRPAFAAALSYIVTAILISEINARYKREILNKTSLPYIYIILYIHIITIYIYNKVKTVNPMTHRNSLL